MLPEVSSSPRAEPLGINREEIKAKNDFKKQNSKVFSRTPERLLELTENMNKKLAELNETMQNMNVQFNKILASMKQTTNEFRRQKNFIESIGTRSHQCEERVSELESKADAGGYIQGYI